MIPPAPALVDEALWSAQVFPVAGSAADRGSVTSNQRASSASRFHAAVLVTLVEPRRADPAGPLQRLLHTRDLVGSLR